MNNKKEHESYGMLNFSRLDHTCKLFGSSITQSNTILLKITRSKKERDLSSEWYFPTEPLIEVEMTYSQFYEAISSMNMHLGVPVTLRHIGRANIEDPPVEENIQDTFLNEFKTNLESSTEHITSALTKLQELLNEKKTLTKSDKETLIQELNKAKSGLGSSAEFICEQFKESLQKTIVESKQEVEAFVNNKIYSVGLESLKQLTNPRITDNESEVK